MDESKANSSYYQVINNLTYSGKIEKHAYSLMVGQDLSESKWNGLSGSGSSLPSNEIHSLNLTDQITRNTSSYFGSSSMVSFLARATYNFDDRYLGTFTFRRDGSSNFGPKNRWANFTSFAVSWRFSNEAFLKSQDILSNGKLRVGWGQTGNQGIGGYRWGSSISTMPSGFGPGYRQGNIANPYVHWETQEQWNVGLDLGFLRDRINFVIEAYDKTSGDMLMQLDLPSYMGTKGNGSSALAAPWGNYGSINNKGLEISLNTRNLQGAFEWDTDIQLTFSKNKLVSLAPGTPPLMGYPQWGGMGSPVTRTLVGEPLYNFYGYVTDGYFKDRADIDNSPKTAAYPKDGTTFNMFNTVWVGDIKYKDISGPDDKPDGIIDDYDRTDLGSPLPKFQFGMNNTFRYKNFDLNLFINGSYGNKIFNYVSIDLTQMSGYRNQLQIVANKRARTEAININKEYDGTNGVWNWYQDIDNIRLGNNPSLPRATQSGDPNNNSRFSDRYLEDGSYLRIKNIVLGYTFPSKWTRKFQVENLRVYANIQNLYTFTKYSGYDPEVGVSTMTSNVFGMDNGRYPSPQSYTFGLNISF
jgi:TonB-linked SusC/RagA family outer membrane protein